MMAMIDTHTCPDCRTRCGHEELGHCAADGPRPDPASIHAMLLDAEIQLASGAELAAMLDAARAQVRRCARLDGLTLGADNDRLRLAMEHDAQAHGANVRQLDDEIARRACRASGAPIPRRAIMTSFYDDGTVPETYRCSQCDAHGIKLWRQYMTTADAVDLLCGACALTEQKRTGPIDANGKIADTGARRVVGRRTDQIGHLVPAVPDEENAAFWGYSAVPDAGVRWWRSLSTVAPPLSPDNPRRPDGAADNRRG